MCEPKHKMWVLHLFHATAMKSLKCLLLSLRAEKEHCHIKSFCAWLNQYKQTRVSLFKPVPRVAPQTKLTLAPSVWRERPQTPLTLGLRGSLRGSPWQRLLRCHRWQVPPPLAAWKRQITAAAIKTWAVQGDGERKPDTGNNQTKWNSSCSVSSAETPLSHSADNNAQGWDNRKCQLIRQREKQREREAARERDG